MGINRYETIEEAAFEKADFIRGITRRFEAAEERFRAGKRSALFDTLSLCAQYQAVIPEWAADELLQGLTDIICGKRNDFNELFGSQRLPSQGKRRREELIRKNQQRVVSMLKAHRCRPDGSFNAEYAFGGVSEQSGLPRRIVEEIYKRSKEHLKQITKGNPEDHIVLDTIFIDLPIARRRGRPLL